MKLQMSLPQRPGLIYTMPVLDILVLVLIFPLLGSSFSTNAGVELKLEDTGYRYERMERSIIVTIKGVDEREIYVNNKPVRERDLLDELAEEAKKWKGGGLVSIVYRVDVRVPSGYKMRIANSLLKEGYQIYNQGNPARR